MLCFILSINMHGECPHVVVVETAQVIQITTMVVVESDSIYHTSTIVPYYITG